MLVVFSETKHNVGIGNHCKNSHSQSERDYWESVRDHWKSDGKNYGRNVESSGVVPEVVAYSSFVGDECPTGMMKFNEMCVDVDY